MSFTLQQCDIAINWSGGLHHAKKYEVSSAVYILRSNQRVQHVSATRLVSEK